MVEAIKPDYYAYTGLKPGHDVWLRQDHESYSNFIVYLKKQDPAHPRWVGGHEAACVWAKRPEDVISADRYLEMKIEELKKYGADARQIEAVQWFIDQHRALGEAKK